MSLVAASPGPRFRVLGLEGAYEKHGLDPQEEQSLGGLSPADPEFGREPRERWGRLVRGDTVTPVETERGDYPRFYQEMARAIREGSAPPVAAGDAISTLEILEAARRSAATGTVVSIP
jgi:predicted dehydrogenase